MNCASYSPDGARIITGSANFSVLIWDMNGHVVHELQGHKAEITKAMYAPDGTYILTASKDGVAMLWDPEGNPVKILENSHRTAIEDIGFSGNSEYFYTLSKKPYLIQVWNRKGELINIINLGDAAGREHCTQFSDDSKSLLVITNTAGRVYMKKWPLYARELIDNVDQRHIFGIVRQLSAKEKKEFYIEN